MKTEWSIDTKFALQAKFKQFSSAHPREYASLFANLNRILQHLRGGAKVGGFQIGFFRSEGAGVYRIGQSGVPHAKESRLYVFPEQNNQTGTMYILTIGDKDSQSQDVNDAKGIVAGIRDENQKKTTLESGK